MSEEGDPAPHVDVGAERGHPAEQLEDEPQPQDHVGRQVDRRDEDEHHERQDPPAGEHDEIGAEHRRDGPGRAQVGDHGVRSDRDLGGRRRESAQDVEDEVERRAQLVLDVVAEHPQEQHVAQDVQPPSVQKHRHEDGVPPHLLAALLSVPLHELTSLGLRDVELIRDRSNRVRPTLVEVLGVAHLVWDERVAEEELLLILGALEDRLPKQERRDVQHDDRERDEGKPGGRVLVLEGDHGPLRSAKGGLGRIRIMSAYASA
jgi:hypothetical protein